MMMANVYMRNHGSVTELRTAKMEVMREDVNRTAIQMTGASCARMELNVFQSTKFATGRRTVLMVRTKAILVTKQTPAKNWIAMEGARFYLLVQCAYAKKGLGLTTKRKSVK